MIAGHTILGGDLPALLGLDAGVREVPVPGGPVRVADAADVVFVQRHGHVRYVPAAWVDHHAHAAAFAALGCDRVLALVSVGGLHVHLPVGTVVVPDDFIALAAQPDSRFTDARGHTVPGFDRHWRARVVDAWTAHAPAPPFDGGVYWQTTGPRFETPAEVRFLAAFADVVGMTAGSECVAHGEAGIAYAAVAVVDNLANGVAPEPLTVEEFEAGKAANREMVVETLGGALPALVA